MGFFSSIGDIFHNVGRVLGRVVGHIGNALHDVVSTVGPYIPTILENVASYFTGGLPLTAMTDAAKLFSAVTGKTNSTSNIGRFINDVGGTAYTAIKDIGNFASDINTNVVQKYITPIFKIIDTVDNLINKIHLSLTNGLRGVVQIPGEIAGAFGSVAAISKINTDNIINGNAAIARQILAGGYPGVAGIGLDKITEVLTKYTTLPELKYKPLKNILLNEPPTYDQGLQEAEDFMYNMAHSDTWLGVIASTFINAVNFLPIIAESFEVAIKQGHQSVNAKQPLELLNPDQIAEALLRGEIDPKQAEEEALKGGIDPTRLKMITDINRTLLDPKDLALARQRKLISNENYIKKILQHGYTTEGIALTADLAMFWPTIAEAIEWQARGAINEDAKHVILEQNGVTQSQEEALRIGILKPADPDLLTAIYGRLFARSLGYLGADLGTAAPPDLEELSAKNMITDEQVQLNWVAHWMDMPANDWISAFFRGLVNEKDLDLALTAHNIPHDLKDKMVGVERELIPIWLVPEIMQSGVITDAESQGMLSKLGIAQENIDIIQKYSRAKNVGPLRKHTEALQQLSLSNLRTMYLDGILDENDYKTGLMDHGYAKVSAALLVEVEEMRKELKERKQTSLDIIAEINFGQITPQDGLRKLYNLGLSEGEIAQFKNKIKSVKVNRTKLPSQSELTKMLSAGIIDDTIWSETMILIGFSEAWTIKLLELVKS